MEGENKIPSIRFKGFNNDWEQCKLDGIADVRDGTHDSPQYFSQGHPFITSKNVGGGYINYDDVQYISDSAFEEINKRSKVDTNDILMGMIGTIGNMALVREKPNFAIKNVALIKDTKAVYYIYLYHYLHSSSVMKQLNNGMDGGTQKFIALNKIRDLAISVPSDKEQRVVGDFMESIDNLITLHQSKLQKLINTKKAMVEKMFPQNGSNVPEIRFKGFTDSWEQRKFCETFTSLKNNSLSRAELNYEQGTVKNIHYGDVLIKFSEVLNVEKEEIPYISNEDFAAGSAALLQNGDIIIADAAEDETVGKCSEITGEEGIQIVSGLHTIPCRPITKFASGYLGYYMNSNAYHDQLLPLIQGTKISSISKSALQDTNIFYPDQEEQKRIGSFLLNLDNLITLHQHKLEKLQNVKKACLQKMFV